MKRLRLILAVSALLNAVLLGVLAYRETQFRLQRTVWEFGVPSWPRYAGSMQAHADFGSGVRRYYRPTPATSTNDRRGFTGERDGDAEVWSWIYHAELPGSRAEAESFAESYNKRMRGYMTDPNSYERHGLAASRPAD